MSDAQEIDLPQWNLDDLGKHIEEIKRSEELPTWAKEQAFDPFMPDPELFMYQPILKECPYCLQMHEFHLIEQCPSKPQKHYCQCGREADIFCDMSSCDPGTWWCNYHFTQEHVCPVHKSSECFCPTHAHDFHHFYDEVEDEECTADGTPFTEIPWDYEKEEWLEEMDGYIQEWEEYRIEFN